MWKRSRRLLWRWFPKALVMLTVALCGCISPPPTDELGMVARGLVLVQLGPYDLQIWKLDGSSAQRFELPGNRHECNWFVVAYRWYGCRAGREIRLLDGALHVRSRLPIGPAQANVAVSPDETMAAYAPGDNGDVMMTIERIGKGASHIQPENVPPKFRVAGPHSWSADSSMLAYEIDDRFCIYTVADGSRNCQVRGQNPAFAPEGKRILFNDLDDRLHILDVTTGSISNLGTEKVAYYARWAADPAYIFFIPKSNLRQLRVVRLSDGKTQPVTFEGVWPDPMISNLHILYAGRPGPLPH